MDQSDEEQKPISPLLLIYSHARTNPISSPDLTYDLRSVPNPPKQIRDKYTGVDKRLQEHMRSHGDFVALIDRAEAEIKALMGLTVGAFKAPPKGRSARAKTDGADDDDEEEEEEGDEDRPRLRVGAFCVRGQHRGVAFVEELASREWPEGWEVRVVHRDLGKGRRESGGKGDGRRGSLGRGFLGEDESD